MGLFSKIFSKKNTNVNNLNVLSPECQKILELKDFFDSLLVCDHYVSRKEYSERIENSKDIINYFDVLLNSGTLGQYCKNNKISSADIKHTLNTCKNIQALIDNKNNQYVKNALVSEKDYLDNILYECDPKIKLDEDQRKVVLCDEDYTLVVAGAGAGKTTTVAAKVKYLVDKKNINPKKILVISFTNKAVNELKERINGNLHIDCPICTFHAAGNAILKKQDNEKHNIADDWTLYKVIQNYFRHSILKNESNVNNLILFFASYFDAPYEGKDLNQFFNSIAKSNFSSMRSEITDFKREVIDSRSKKSITIQNEFLRSNEEVEIANFLFLNGIDYEYERIYPYNISFARKPYTPDFVIKQGDNIAYIEHFGITEDGHHDRYGEDELNAYKRAINTKIELHKKHGTKLIYTFSIYNDRRSITEHLKEQLETNGFVISPRSNKEVMEMLISTEENRYIRKLVSLITRFIQNFKTNGFCQDEFTRMYYSTQNVRSRLFLNICEDCYVEYERFLKENNAIDFEDMINESARILRDVAEMKQKLAFDYVIVDEYQDISHQRFDLVSALHNVTDAKIVAVGDDWQSIYAFSGSDITLFTKFREKMGYGNLQKIVRTYRNSQEVIDIAGNFIQKNKEQIEKDLISPKRITDPVIIYTYDSTKKAPNGNLRTGVNYAIAHAIEVALEQIIQYNKQENKPYQSSILLLGRYGFDGDLLEKTGLFEYINRGTKIKSVKYPNLNITFMTAHASKGLGYDNVIVINGRNETYGFPSKIEDDPVLSFVIKGDTAIDYAEERRLFYVAMTRTKNRVYFIAPEQNPSEFLLEIKHDYKNVVLRGEWNENPKDIPSNKKHCPLCGYPMQYRYKNAYGLRLHICTNDPEVCGFMTNDFRGGKLSIMKCDQCRDGFLIIKPTGKGDYFLGCTNYKTNKTGCNATITREYYYKLMDIGNSTPARPVTPKKGIDIKIKESSKTNENLQKKLNEKYDFISPTIEKAEIKNNASKAYDMNEIVITTLQCLSNISQDRFYGVTMLANILRGSSSEKIKVKSLEQIKQYGALSHLKREEVITVIEWLIENKYILRTKGLYPVLHPTYKGIHYKETITARKLNKLAEALAKENESENIV